MNSHRRQVDVRGGIFNRGPKAKKDNTNAPKFVIKLKGVHVSPLSKNNDLEPGSAREPYLVSRKEVSIATGALSPIHAPPT